MVRLISPCPKRKNVLMKEIFIRQLKDFKLDRITSQSACEHVETKAILCKKERKRLSMDKFQTWIRGHFSSNYISIPAKYLKCVVELFLIIGKDPKSDMSHILCHMFYPSYGYMTLTGFSNGLVKNGFTLNSICRYICSDISTHYTRWRNRLPWWTPAWRPTVRHFENRKILSGP